MTQAQKIAKAKFKQAIAYRTKTGVSLKEAFAHIYGKKKVVKKAIKKSAPKKVDRKKAVKKVAKKRIAGPKDSAMVKKELAKKGLKMPHGYATIKRKRKISGVKKKKITEKGILNKIHIVKRNVDKLDEAQHKHMMGAVDKEALKKYGEIIQNINKAENHIKKYDIMLKDVYYSPINKKMFKVEIEKWKKYLSELKKHKTEIKKLL